MNQAALIMAHEAAETVIWGRPVVRKNKKYQKPALIQEIIQTNNKTNLEANQVTKRIKQLEAALVMATLTRKELQKK